MLGSLFKMCQKQHWSNEHLKCLLETCIEQVNTVGRKGFSLHKESWFKLGGVLKERFQMDLAQKQMKNAYDNLKAKYVGWVYLKNKTGNMYNPQTNSFTLSAEEWEEFRKGHPKAASLKTTPLPYPDLCATLFDGSSGCGNLKWTSTQTSAVGSSSPHHIETLQITDTPFCDLEDDDGTSHQTADHTPDSSDPATGASVDPAPSALADSGHTTSPDVDRPGKRAKSTNTRVDDLLEKALELLLKAEPLKGPTVEQCYEKLKIVELDPTDPLFLAAFYIFGVSVQMREAWMILPAIHEVLKGWIRGIATTLGYFK